MSGEQSVKPRGETLEQKLEIPSLFLLTAILLLGHWHIISLCLPGGGVAAAV